MWFRTYLTNRKLYLQYNESKRSGLFAIPSYLLKVKNFKFIFFFAPHEKMDVLFKIINENLDSLSGWFKANKLSMYVKKKPLHTVFK